MQGTARLVDALAKHARDEEAVENDVWLSNRSLKIAIREEPTCI